MSERTEHEVKQAFVGGPVFPANGGRVRRSSPEWWTFEPSEPLRTEARKLLGREPARRVHFQNFGTNGTPPIIAQVGAFVSHRTGTYFEPRLPAVWRDAWRHVQGMS